MQAQRVEIIVIRGTWVGEGDGLEAWRRLVSQIVVGNRIFGIEHEAVQVGQYAQHRLAGALGQPVQPGLQKTDIAAEAVDDKTHDAISLRRREQLQRADQMGEDAATIDVGNKNHRTVDSFGKTHVGNVARA